MAAASGLDKFRFVDTDLSKLEENGSPEGSNSGTTNNTGDSVNQIKNNCNQENSQPNAAAAATAAAAAASRLLSLQRDLGCNVSNPMDFLKQLEASNRNNRGGFDRLMSLAGFGFPGLPGLPPLAPLVNPDLELSKSVDQDRLTPINENSSRDRGELFQPRFYYNTCCVVFVCIQVFVDLQKKTRLEDCSRDISRRRCRHNP